MTTIEELDIESVIVILHYYNGLPYSFKKFISFYRFVKHNVFRLGEGPSRFCQYGVKCIADYDDDTDPFCRFGFLDETGGPVVNPKYNCTTSFETPFYFLLESEETSVRKVLKK